ncbi:hypothetical protein TNCV_1408561 [Trichonephila clavipes]|uniref:Uncharacterized protein n=1 Tax=Trichonephila clavipes TaxID=2585209 RepID=A0A8X6UWG6_TRICX|nr:hypothetical protein TNCV_1408561 [Trichonephila clavipes]
MLANMHSDEYLLQLMESFENKNINSDGSHPKTDEASNVYRNNFEKNESSGAHKTIEGIDLHYRNHLGCYHPCYRFTHTELADMHMIYGLAEQHSDCIAQAEHQRDCIVKGIQRKIHRTDRCLLICITIFVNMDHYEVLVIVRAGTSDELLAWNKMCRDTVRGIRVPEYEP